MAEHFESAALSVTNPTSPDPDRRDKKLATNRLSYSTACVLKVCLSASETGNVAALAVKLHIFD
jgi:hypothetical protein